MASALILTERDATDEDNAPKTAGRIVTTLPKAKEVRPLVERCVRIACVAWEKKQEADKLGTTEARNSAGWKSWRESEKWSSWAKAMAPVVAARRRLIVLLGDKKAVAVLLDVVAPRFLERNGGYTRIMKLAKPRLGDNGARAILEFVGKGNDRVKRQAVRPTFDAGEPEAQKAAE